MEIGLGDATPLTKIVRGVVYNRQHGDVEGNDNYRLKISGEGHSETERFNRVEMNILITAFWTITIGF